MAMKLIKNRKFYENGDLVEGDVYSAKDYRGITHYFRISSETMGRCCWDAVEVYEKDVRPSTHYKFSIVDEDKDRGFKRLEHKVEASLKKQTVSDNGYMKTNGSIYIGRDGLMVEGKVVTPQEFFRLLHIRGGQRMDYVINDIYSEPFCEGMTLMKTRVDNIEEEFTRLSRMSLETFKYGFPTILHKLIITYSSTLFRKKACVPLLKIMEGMEGVEDEIDLLKRVANDGFADVDDNGNIVAGPVKDDFSGLLESVKKLNGILIIEGNKDFDMSDAIIIDCEKSKDREIKGYTVFKNADCLTTRGLDLIRFNAEDKPYPVIIMSKNGVMDRVDAKLKWRAMFYQVL